MGCNQSVDALDDDPLKEPESEKVTVEDKLAGYPPPKPPPNRKADFLSFVDFTELNKHVAKVTPDSAKTLEDLTRLLIQNEAKDVMKVWAIFKWMGTFSNYTSPFTNFSPESPLGYIQKRKDREISYSAFFAIMCRAIDIPCVIVRGIAKSAVYEVGDRNPDVLRNSWCAVYISGAWRFVFPLWAFQVVVGHSTGIFTKIEAKGQGVRESEKASEGNVVSRVNDFFFLTDPEVLIHLCLPDDPEWQLLATPISQEKFFDLPYLKYKFFENNLKIVSLCRCLLYADTGELEVAIKSQGETDISFSYDLFYNNKESRSVLPPEIQLERYVVIINQPEKATFSIRFPVEGTYKIDIFRELGEEEDWVCAFKMICNKVKENCHPFPFNPKIGFGPCNTTKTYGIQAITHQTGSVQVKSNQETEFKFSLAKYVNIKTSLVTSSTVQADLTNCVSHRIQNDLMHVCVTTPSEGEYALVIDAKEKNTSQEYANVCNYLLHTEEHKKRRGWENAFQNNARRALRKQRKFKDVNQLQKAIEKANKYEIEDKGDVSRAKNRLKFLQLQKDLDDGIKRRNLDVLEPAIERAKQSKYQNRLSSKILDAETLALHLREIKRFAHEILEMKQTTISEIHRYAIPPTIIYEVMKATYLLLGEKPHLLEQWEEIQGLMRRTGRHSLLYRVRKFDTVGVDPGLVEQVQGILSLYSQEQATLASAGAGTFYKWANNIATQMLEGSKTCSDQITEDMS